MLISELQVNHLRNLEFVQLYPKPFFNFFFGENGSGKTTLLEAIYHLGTAKSFRTHIHPRMISYHANTFSIFSKLSDNFSSVTVGLERSLDQKLKMRIAEKDIKHTSSLAKLLPLQILTHHSDVLLTMGASYRRNFINWGMFHVEHSFANTWKKLNKVIKQRNSLLKHSNIDQQIELWDLELCQISNSIFKKQQEYLKKLLPLAQTLWQYFIQSDHLIINMEFYPGWPLDESLEHTLLTTREQDLKYGYTRSGSHRSDLLLRINQYPVQDILSRGQQKLLVYALKIAQGILLQHMSGRSCLYLIDDLQAELDQQKCCFVLEKLQEIKAQVFITGIQVSPLEAFFKQEGHGVFHVEHGVIHEISGLKSFS